MPAESLDTAERRLLFTRCLQITHDLIAHGADPDDPRMVDLYDEIGRLQTLAGAYKQAEQWFNEALTVMVQTLSPPPELMMRLQYGLARVDERRGKFKRAIQRMEQAVSIEESRESAEYRSCLLLLAGLYQRRGDNAQSL
jgi:tetratricopeptide (TPR) repeat protein